MTTLITGAFGQDGLLMSRLLQSKSLPFVGLCRPGTGKRYLEAIPGAKMVEVDLANSNTVFEILSEIRPHQIINFAGYSSVIGAWNSPQEAITVNSVLPAVILNWIVEESPKTKLIQASSAEMYSPSNECPQVEESIHNPKTVYGASKSLAHNIVIQFRNRYGISANNVILFNHESPLRSTDFVTQHVATSVAKISLGIESQLKIGNLFARRDWGWAPDYVSGVFLSANSPDNEDFLFATGRSHSVEDLVRLAFDYVGINNWQERTVVDTKYQRVDDTAVLVGDAKKANRVLNWKAIHSFDYIVENMVQSAIEKINNPKNYNWLENAIK